MTLRLPESTSFKGAAHAPSSQSPFCFLRILLRQRAATDVTTLGRGDWSHLDNTREPRPEHSPWHSRLNTQPATSPHWHARPFASTVLVESWPADGLGSGQESRAGVSAVG